MWSSMMFMFSHHFVWVLINVERDRMGVCLRDLKRVRTGIKPRQMRATLRNGPKQSTDWKVMESRKVNVCVCVCLVSFYNWWALHTGDTAWRKALRHGSRSKIAWLFTIFTVCLNSYIHSMFVNILDNVSIYLFKGCRPCPAADPGRIG